MEKGGPDSSGESAVGRLVRFFRRNGYVRRQNARRVQNEGWGRYKKGDEVRFVAESPQELRLIGRLLRDTGFTPGRPFAKGRQYCQPVYGRQAVARFLELVDEEDDV